MSAQTLRVPWAMSSAVQVRRTLVSELRVLEVNETVIDEAEIVISELVANAIRHAQPLPDGMIHVNWAVSDGVVEISVTDGGGPTTPAPAGRDLRDRWWRTHHSGSGTDLTVVGQRPRPAYRSQPRP